MYNNCVIEKDRLYIKEIPLTRAVLPKGRFFDITKLLEDLSRREARYLNSRDPKLKLGSTMEHSGIEKCSRAISNTASQKNSSSISTPPSQENVSADIKAILKLANNPNFKVPRKNITPNY